MIKNWLIRTKNNHILGPLSKEKVRELYYSKSIKDEDEICSGNGYWFFIKEKNLIDKHLIGDQPQGYNIVSEADSVLCAGPVIPETFIEEEENMAPPADDLEYPELEVVEEDVMPNLVELDYEDSKKIEIKSTQHSSLKKKNDFILYVVAVVFLAIAIFAFMYRKNIISKFISNISIIENAHAQRTASNDNFFLKKKMNLSL